MQLLALALLGISAMANASDTKSGVQRIGEPTLNGTRLPFSTAVRAGDTVYLSGALGITTEGKLADGMEAQARLAMDNLGAALKSALEPLGIECTVRHHEDYRDRENPEQAMYDDLVNFFADHLAPGHSKAVPRS